MHRSCMIPAIAILATAGAGCGENGSQGSGAPGTAVSAASIPPGDECPAGGVEIATGFDSNANGELDEDEVLGTETVCNGEAGPQGPAGPTLGSEVVTVFSEGPVSALSARTVTVQSASITVDGSGTVVAIAATDAFCQDCGGGSAEAVFAITDSETGPIAPDDPRDFFDVSSGNTVSATRTRSFAVTSAGTFTYYARVFSDSADEVVFFRNELTLIFLPDAP